MRGIYSILLIFVILVLLSNEISFSGHDKVESGENRQGEKASRTPCPEGMIYIPGGMVTSIQDEKKKLTSLTYIDKFCIDKYEFPNKNGESPSINVTWYEAEVYCKKEGKRLCTNEEWEKACAGRNWYKYTYGDKYIPSKCGLGGEVRKDVDKSGTHPDCVSDYGVYDMIGGVWEWTSSYSEIFVKRGGYVNAGPDEANCFFRLSQPPKSAGIHDGFRCCKDVPAGFHEK